MEEKIQFNPIKHGLNKNFRLTNFSDLKGWGCKVPQKILNGFLKAIEPSSTTNKQQLGTSYIYI